MARGDRTIRIARRLLRPALYLTVGYYAGIVGTLTAQVHMAQGEPAGLIISLAMQGAAIAVLGTFAMCGLVGLLGPDVQALPREWREWRARRRGRRNG